MTKRRVAPEAFRRRLVGLYALTLMEREGPLHGYALSDRIARRTEGAWRPGPGSVYPSLHQLVEHGLARARLRARRRIYTITPRGRALLERFREGGKGGGRSGPDLSGLWAEVFGSSDIGEFMLRRLRHAIGAVESHLARGEDGGGGAGDLRRAVVAELAQASRRLARSPRSRPRGKRQSAR